MPACNRPARNYEDDLKAYADGELSRLRRFAVRRHLTYCASCREEISQMTQLTEDLRSSESDTPLPRELREKILGIGEPTPQQAATLPRGEGEESRGRSKQRPYDDKSPHLPASGRPPRSNLLRSKEVGFRTRLAWSLPLFVLLWFVMFPLFQTVRDNSRRTSPMASTQEAQIKVFKDSREAAAAPANSTRRLQISGAINDQRAAITTGGGIPLVPDAPQRQVHKEATLGVQVPNPEATGDTVAAMVTERGGYVASNTLDTGPDGLKTAELVVKVPVTQFDSFLRQVAKLGVVQSKNITGEDITEQTSDADQAESVLEDDVRQSQARLNALGSKAKWRDEQAARDLRIQLAQTQARLVLLKRMAALSTVTIDLTQTPKAPVVPPVTGGFLSHLKDTTHDALQSLLSSGGTLLALVIWLLTYAPLWIPMVLIGRYALKQYRKRQVV